MKRIFKYKLEPTDIQEVRMPRGAIALSAHEQYGELCLWAFVDDGYPMVERKVRVIGTGNPVPADIDNYEYVGTVLLMHGTLVAHVWIGDDPERKKLDE